ncbi:MAG: hypothetical protein ACLT9J_10665 [Agathobacter rectalis]
MTICEVGTNTIKVVVESAERSTRPVYDHTDREDGQTADGTVDQPADGTDSQTTDQPADGTDGQTTDQPADGTDGQTTDQPRRMEQMDRQQTRTQSLKQKKREDVSQYGDISSQEYNDLSETICKRKVFFQKYDGNYGFCDRSTCRYYYQSSIERT